MASQDSGCGFVGCLLLVPSLLFWYVAAVVVFRYAFGIELPNPLSHLMPDWQHIPRSSS
jgi:hypothetical protein